MKFVFAMVHCAALVTAISQCHAISTVTITGEPTMGLAGFTTYTLVASSDQGEIVGFNFDPAGDSGFGFYGPMNQVNPFGIITVFDDLDELYYLAYGSSNGHDDSHFNVAGSTGIVLNPVASPESLTAAFSLSGSASFVEFPLAQLVIPDGGSVYYAGQMAVNTSGGILLEYLTGTVGSVAVPDIPANSNISLQSAFDDQSGLLANALNLTNGNGDNSELMILGVDIEVTSGPADIFDSSTTGLSVDFLLDLSSAGTLPVGTLVTADAVIRTNGGNLAYTLSATVPEPATLSMIGVALVGITAQLRRRRRGTSGTCS